MARRRNVDISETQYEAAIAAREEGATKKRQCELLGIAYNTKRLDELLEEYQDEKVRRKEMMKKNRTKPISPQEQIMLAESYLQGESLEGISKRLYRSQALIKRRLIMMGVFDLRFNESANPLAPHMVPDEAMADSFEIGQKVWVPGYKCLGEIKVKYTDQPDGVDAYRVYLLDAARHRNVTYKAYDLGSLAYLEELGVDTRILEDNMQPDEIKVLLGEALKKARMRAKEK